MTGPVLASRSTQKAALDPNRTKGEAQTLHRTAARGLSSPPSPFPYSERIQAAFGAYAPSGLAAHFGPAARAAAGQLQAHAYVKAGQVAFGRFPDLRTAAHEAAHIVDQTHGGGGVRHGVGVQGDARERLADQVASRVASNRSAEDLFASALGPANPSGAIDQLQMTNSVAEDTSVEKPTPWKEIADQLGLTVPYVVDRFITVEKVLKPTIQQLKESCPKAHSVTADLDGIRDGEKRVSDPMQTAYGNLGNIEELLTKTPSVAKYDFEGGHLIADQILGDRSYFGGNFAPQRRTLNSPVYRMIEKIGKGGTRLKVGGKPGKRPNWTMKVSVAYPSDTYEVDKDQVISQLLINPLLVSSTAPDKVTLTSRVPSRWIASTDTNSDDWEFTHESILHDGSSTQAGYMASEDDVIKAEPNTTLHLDSTNWSMDTLTDTPLSGQGVGTGRKRRHTFSSIQAVPRGQTTFLGSPLVVAKPKVAFKAPSTKTRRQFSGIPKFGSASISKRKALVRPLAKELAKELSEHKISIASFERGLLAFGSGFDRLRNGQEFVPSDAFNYVVPLTEAQKRNKRDAPRKKRKKEDDPSKLSDQLAIHVIMQNFDNDTGFKFSF